MKQCVARNSAFRLLPAVCLSLALFAAAAAEQAVSAADGSTDERLLDGLRKRRLFDLAELYCRERLDRPDLPDGERLDLVLELSRTYAAHAIESPAATRNSFWKQAHSALEQFQQQHPQHPRLLSLGLQRALVELAAGELGRQEAEVGGSDAAGLAAARKSLREAINQLQQLDVQAATELQRHSRTAKNEPGQWTAAELVSLQTTMRYHQARAFRNQALTYPRDSSDRLNALSQALELLRPLAQLLPETNLAWLARVDEVTCSRLLRDFSLVDRKLAALAKEEPPAAVRQRLEAERIRSALDQGEIDKGLAAAGKPGQRTADDAAELDFARLEAYVAAWRAAADRKEPAAGEWERAAVDQVRFIEQAHSPYWMRRAETLLAGAIAAGPGSESLDTLVRAAESYYRGGKLDEAVAAYDRAVAQARRAQAADRAFELAYVAATIEHQAHHFREAMNRYRALALAAPQHAKASQAHLLAVFDAAQLAQQQAGEPQAGPLAEYQQLLEEHLRTWPQAATTGQAAWWLGQIREHALAWPDAVAAYRLVPAGHAQFVAAIDATARCYRSLLAESRAAGKPNERLAADGARYFESLIVGPDGRSPEPWTPAARQAALAAARLWLDEVHGGQAQAEEVLNAAVAHSADAPAEWLSAARSLLITALAVQGRFDDATRLIDRFSPDATEILLALCDALARRAAAAAGDGRTALGRLQLAVLERADSEHDKLTPDERRRLDRQRATALLDAGQREAGLALMEKLAQESPDDGQIHETLAEMLSAGDAADRKQALVKWREVQRKSRPGSPRWFRSNYGLARTQFLLGNKAEARAIIRLVRKARPDLGGKEMKARYEQLLAECER